MKKILSILIAIMMSVLSAYAQIDIKQFNKVGPEAVSALLGNPPEQWRDDVYTDSWILGDEEYLSGICSFGARIVLDYDDNALLGFDTKSPNYIFLSDYIIGGVRVGDSISKVEAYDFVHTEYGRNKESNALKKYADYPDGTTYYTIFDEELQVIYIGVENNTIIDISFYTCEEDPYPDYDYTNLLIM